MPRLLIALAIVIMTSPLLAQPLNSFDPYVHIEKENISKRQLAVNFGYKYILQWGFYYLSQRETIEDHASWHNWRHYPFSPHFDRDNLENNIINHSMAGASYYLFYRSRGYSKSQAFLWANASSLAFEFTIETFTERPSYQDIFLTPTLGTAVGIGAENLSNYFHSKKVWPARVLGYIFNPFTLLPRASYGFRAFPIVRESAYLAVFEIGF